MVASLLPGHQSHVAGVFDKALVASLADHGSNAGPPLPSNCAHLLGPRVQKRPGYVCPSEQSPWGWPRGILHGSGMRAVHVPARAKGSDGAQRA